MSKRIIRIVCCFLLIITIVVAGMACAEKQPEQASEPAYAGLITENILLAINENDYVKFSENFDEVMKEAMPEDAFQQMCTVIRDAIGDYTAGSIQFSETNEGQFTSVYYKAKFTQEPEEVTVNIAFLENNGNAHVFGVWLDSPKLRAS